MTQYQKGILVMDYLQSLGIDMSTIGTAIDDFHLGKSYQLIKDNPQITKADFLEIMEIAEEEYNTH